MKVEIEIPDLEEVFCSEYEEESIKAKDFKHAIINIAIEKLIDQIYDEYMDDKIYFSIKDTANELLKEHSKEIIDTVIDKVSNEIMRKKAIVEQMPKKSEVANIDKEWEKYFIELIDKAIAKRFK